MSVKNEFKMQELFNLLLLGDMEFDFSQKMTKWGKTMIFTISCDDHPFCTVIYNDEYKCFEIFDFRHDELEFYETAQLAFREILQRYFAAKVSL